MKTIDKVSSLSESELTKLIDLDKHYFPYPWSLESWKTLDLSDNSLFIFKINTEIVGFGLFYTVDGLETAHLLKICLLPEFRGKGMANMFLFEMMKDISSHGFKEAYLEVNSLNLAAINLYNRNGFQKVHFQKNFYGAGQHALKMVSSLI
jgi:ribosomal-protein-alanine N-acetyltransferase